MSMDAFLNDAAGGLGHLLEVLGIVLRGDAAHRLDAREIDPRLLLDHRGQRRATAPR
jgi:hypothetical protein